MKKLKFLLPLGIFLALAAFLLIGLGLNPREVPSPLIGKPAPAFDLPRLDDPGQRVRREDLLGKVWMLNVWASWCAACRDEHPLLVEMAARKIVPCSTPTGAWASIGAFMACRRPSSSTVKA